jgi:hypothetical protein
MRRALGLAWFHVRAFVDGLTRSPRSLAVLLPAAVIGWEWLEYGSPFTGGGPAGAVFATFWVGVALWLSVAPLGRAYPPRWLPLAYSRSAMSFLFWAVLGVVLLLENGIVGKATPAFGKHMWIFASLLVPIWLARMNCPRVSSRGEMPCRRAFALTTIARRGEVYAFSGQDAAGVVHEGRTVRSTSISGCAWCGAASEDGWSLTVTDEYVDRLVAAFKQKLSELPSWKEQLAFVLFVGMFVLLGFIVYQIVRLPWALARRAARLVPDH